MKSTLFFLCSFFLASMVYSQTTTYTITANGHTIGKLYVSKSHPEDYTQVSVVSDVKVKLFISVDIKYKLNATYKNNELLNSAVTVYVKGKLHSSITTTKTGDYYTIVDDGHSSQYLHKITYSSALLFIKEPKGISSVYSDFGGEPKPLSKIGLRTYELINPGSGHIETYEYLPDGSLQKATIQHSLLTFELTQKK